MIRARPARQVSCGDAFSRMVNHQCFVAGGAVPRRGNSIPAVSYGRLLGRDRSSLPETAAVQQVVGGLGRRELADEPDSPQQAHRQPRTSAGRAVRTVANSEQMAWFDDISRRVQCGR